MTYRLFIIPGLETHELIYIFKLIITKSSTRKYLPKMIATADLITNSVADLTANNNEIICPCGNNKIVLNDKSCDGGIFNNVIFYCCDVMQSNVYQLEIQ